MWVVQSAQSPLGRVPLVPLPPELLLAVVLVEPLPALLEPVVPLPLVLELPELPPVEELTDERPLMEPELPVMSWIAVVPPVLPELVVPLPEVAPLEEEAVLLLALLERLLLPLLPAEEVACDEPDDEALLPELLVLAEEVVLPEPLALPELLEWLLPELLAVVVAVVVEPEPLLDAEEEDAEDAVAVVEPEPDEEALEALEAAVLLLPAELALLLEALLEALAVVVPEPELEPAVVVEPVVEVVVEAVLPVAEVAAWAGTQLPSTQRLPSMHSSSAAHGGTTGVPPLQPPRASAAPRSPPTTERERANGRMARDLGSPDGASASACGVPAAPPTDCPGESTQCVFQSHGPDGCRIPLRQHEERRRWHSSRSGGSSRASRRGWAAPLPRRRWRAATPWRGRSVRRRRGRPSRRWPRARRWPSAWMCRAARRP